MFEAAEVGRTVAKAEYEFEVAKLRWDLLEGQRALERTASPLIVVFGGVDGAGKSETVHLLNEWMDPRWIVNRAFDEPSEDERERPRFWRYWLALPPRGRIGLFLSAWYSQPLLDRVARRLGAAEFDVALDRIASFERTLADDGAIIVKFWMHLDRKAPEEAARVAVEGSADTVARHQDPVEAVEAVRSVRHRCRAADSADQLRSRTVDHRRRHRRAVSKPRRRNRDPARACRGRSSRMVDSRRRGDGAHGRGEGAGPRPSPPSISSRASIAIARSSMRST